MERSKQKQAFQFVKLKDFYNYDQLNQVPEVDEETKTENVGMTEMEIESITSIQNSQEFQVLTNDEVFQGDSDKNLVKISKVFKLSLIPNCNKKFVIHDVPKKITVELRCLPALEIFLAIPYAYPSGTGPLFLMSTQFYKPYEKFLYEQLSQKWSENSPITYECIINIQDDFLNSFFEQADLGDITIDGNGNVLFNYKSSTDFQHVFEQSMDANRRSFNQEEHECRICMRRLLGDKFFFLSGCEHYFCTECVLTMVNQAINSKQLSKLICGEASCKKNLNDLDVRNLNIGQAQYEKYDQISLNNAIAQMDDLGWCPLPGCGSLATIEKEYNFGKCQHCDFMFCLDCRERFHPYKRCLVNRLDLLDVISEAQREELDHKNKRAEEALNILFFRYCAKYCPNLKCGIKIQKEKSGCTKMQCPKCFHHFCWACLHDAKGMKHYKEKPECNNEEPHLQPDFLTYELKSKHLNDGEDYINLKFCAKCPSCDQINEKRTKCNILECVDCSKPFCYICNKSISGPEHFQGKSQCHYESDPWSDF